MVVPIHISHSHMVNKYKLEGQIKLLHVSALMFWKCDSLNTLTKKKKEATRTHQSHFRYKQATRH